MWIKLTIAIRIGTEKKAIKVAAEKDKYMPLFLGLIDAVSNLNDIKSYLETPKIDGTKAINFRSLSYHIKNGQVQSKKTMVQL